MQPTSFKGLLLCFSSSIVDLFPTLSTDLKKLGSNIQLISRHHISAEMIEKLKEGQDFIVDTCVPLEESKIFKHKYIEYAVSFFIVSNSIDHEDSIKEDRRAFSDSAPKFDYILVDKSKKGGCPLTKNIKHIMNVEKLRRTFRVPE